MSGLRHTVRAALLRLGWLALAVLVALGAGGLVAATDHTPGTDARRELTWTGDRAALEALRSAEDTLVALEREVETLGEFGRLALTQLTANDREGLDAAIADGTAALGRAEAASVALAAELDAVPHVGAPDERIRISPDTSARYDAILSALTETDTLARDWRILTTGALDANRMATLLGDHDRLAAEAARDGSRERYAEALELLAQASERLDEAETLRDRLAETIDVVTLTRWLERNRAYDAALTELYEAVLASDGRVTQRVRDAFAAEREAREALPGDTRALVLVMTEIAQGGVNQALIAIEEVRGELDAALAALAQLDAPPADPAAEPTIAPGT